MSATAMASQAYLQAKHPSQPSSPSQRNEATSKGRSYTFIGHSSDSPQAPIEAINTAERVHKTSQSCFASCTYGGTLTTKVAKALVLSVAAGLIVF